MNFVPCTIPCDFCGKKPANFFGKTSVAVCDDEKCIERNSKKWAAHVAEMDADYEFKKEYYGRYFY